MTRERLNCIRKRSFLLSVVTAVGMYATACASAPLPESAMSVMTAQGRLVPLDSMTVAYDVAGVHVIQRSNFANDAVAVNLYLLGGTRQLTASTQGMESLLLSDGAFGTARYPGAAWRTAWGLTGSHLILDPEMDWTLYGFRGIRQEFVSSWDAFADRLMHPTLSSADLPIVRARLIAEIRDAGDSPDNYVTRLADSIAFAGHPYGLEPGGTISTLTALDSASVARYASDQIVKSRMLLVVVGNLSREVVVSAVSRTLASLPEGSYTWSLPISPPAFTPSATLVQRTIPTNYVVGEFRGPPASSPEAPAFRVTLALLSSRLNGTIRDQRSLSYSTSAIWIERGTTSGAIYVSTGSPDAAIPLMADEMRFLKYMPSYVNLHDFTDQFIVDYFGANMTDEAQADFLARAQLYHGDFRTASRAMENLRQVSASDLRESAKRYFRDIRFVYLGDTTLVQRADFAGFADDSLRSRPGTLGSQRSGHP